MALTAIQNTVRSSFCAILKIIKVIPLCDVKILLPIISELILPIICSLCSVFLDKSDSFMLNFMTIPRVSICFNYIFWLHLSSGVPIPYLLLNLKAAYCSFLYKTMMINTLVQSRPLLILLDFFSHTILLENKSGIMQCLVEYRWVDFRAQNNTFHETLLYWNWDLIMSREKIYSSCRPKKKWEIA